MTNEEIEKVAADLAELVIAMSVDNAPSSEIAGLLSSSIREAKAQAYEEAAHAAENMEWGSVDAAAEHGTNACRFAAEAIRELKDSLVQETVSA